MRTLGVLTLALTASVLLSADVLGQRGRSSGSSGSSSRGSSASSQGSRSSGGVSRSSSSGGRSSGSQSSGSSGSRSSGSSGSSGSRSSGSSGSSAQRSSYGSSSSGSSSSYGSSSRSSSSYSSSPRSSSSSSSSSSRDDSSSRDSSSRGSSAPVTPALNSSDYESRFESRSSSSDGLRLEPTRSAIPGVVDIDEARVDRVRFPAPYRWSGSSRPAVPSRSGSRELVGLVDRYREATAASYAASERGSVAPILDRYGRSGRDSNARTSASGRGSSPLELNAERYARGPEQRRAPGGAGTPSSSLGLSASPSRATVLRSAERAARPTSSRASTSQGRARELTQLAARDPQAARRVMATGNVLARSTALGLAAGVSITSGTAAGRLVLSANRPRPLDKGSASSYWGYGYYPWWGGGYSSSWWFGFGWGYGSCGWSPSWCWAPLWTSCWYPYYCYSYNYCYPYYCKPYYYYPFYYSTVVHHVYEDNYQPTVIVVHDDDDAGAVAVADEPVGEAVAADRPVDSPLKLSLSIAAERYLTLGDRAFREGRYSDAAQFYAKAVEYAPNEGVLHLVLADALFATGDYHYAAYSLRRALELDPALALAVVDKHEFYADPADFDQHLAEAEIFVANNPTDSDARLVLAANFLFGNRPAAAVDLLETQSALSLRADTTAALILDAARQVQHGEPAAAKQP